MRTYEKSVFNPFRMRTYKNTPGGLGHKLSPFSSAVRSCYSQPVSGTQGADPMEWTTPTHEEIDLSCEISSYANAEL